MVTKKKRKSLLSGLKNRYRLSIFKDQTYEEVLTFRLTKLNLLSFVGSSIIMLIALTTILIAFTPIREYIPGYPDGQLRRQIVLNALILDSFEHQIRIRDQYYSNLIDIIEGREPQSFEARADTTLRFDDIRFTKSQQDSILRAQVEGEEQFNLLVVEDRSNMNYFRAIHFFPPLKGLIVNRFAPESNHFGVDLVAEPNQPVMAVLDGTVTVATWTLETGYIIQIQHANNFLSFYKHNAELLKNVGDVVRAGETIAIVGNSGELSTGPHLHFELWRSGAPLNPEDFIVF
jgi:ABC-type multidrug transport system fused ATPase/permease subunit